MDNSGLFVVQRDCLISRFGEAIVESSLEIGRRVAKQLLVNMKAFGVCSRADDDMSSRTRR